MGAHNCFVTSINRFPHMLGSNRDLRGTDADFQHGNVTKTTKIRKMKEYEDIILKKLLQTSHSIILKQRQSLWTANRTVDGYGIPRHKSSKSLSHPAKGKRYAGQHKFGKLRRCYKNCCTKSIECSSKELERELQASFCSSSKLLTKERSKF